MHQMAVDAEGAEFDLGVVEPDRGLVGKPDGINIALLIRRDVCRRGGLRIGQGRLLGDAAGDALANLIGVEIESRLGIR